MNDFLGCCTFTAPVELRRCCTTSDTKLVRQDRFQVFHFVCPADRLPGSCRRKRRTISVSLPAAARHLTYSATASRPPPSSLELDGARVQRVSLKRRLKAQFEREEVDDSSSGVS